LQRIDIDRNAEADPEQALRVLSSYGAIQQEMKNLGASIRVRQYEGRSLEGLVPNFCFTGQPGTGKTTVARTIARLLHSFGVLATDQVTETSGANLTGAYVGKAKEIVAEKMNAARGGVLFIDEAYQLGEGSYGREAVSALVEMLTLPEHIGGKTVVILAGYHDEIHAMLDTNPGLKSRFQKFVQFENWTSERSAEFCLELLKKDFSITQSDEMLETLQRGFDDVLRRPGWANGRVRLNSSLFGFGSHCDILFVPALI
jgi:ATP-dependent Clp protease ATP-binding subunit ClpA